MKQEKLEYYQNRIIELNSEITVYKYYLDLMIEQKELIQKMVENEEVKDGDIKV
jgi:transcription elongation factor Elf1